MWTTPYRRKASIRRHENPVIESGPSMQVSRLGDPLSNEVIVPIGDEDEWNAVPPHEVDPAEGGRQKWDSEHLHPASKEVRLASEAIKAYDPGG